MTLKDTEQVDHFVQSQKWKKMERLISSFVKKWLGVPRCMSSIGPYGKGILELPVSSLVEEYKCSKVRLEMTQMDSRDPCITKIVLTFKTRRTWIPAAGVQQGKSA